jgi:glycosyltransferase involved in cell wall biosynthesis
VKDLLTIVIPCKNERNNIYDCVGLLRKQKELQGVRIIIADSSTSLDARHWVLRTRQDFRNEGRVEIIHGGFPAKARLEGSKLVTTPYILFLDADVMVKEEGLLSKLIEYKLDLVTVPFITDRGYNWLYEAFDWIQKQSIKRKIPFAVGGFQLWKTEAYWKLGGYNEEHLFAEDYAISSKVSVDKFRVHNTDGVYTSARRFKNKGIFHLVWLMIRCYLNRNNEKFFKHHHNYWK